ncbi:MAG: enoyl-CoA hydratase [Alphaproteobacteria bacterium]|nr:enoyl-CoA hydratase [Alphaproteobacteria bacterium]MCY4498109.1 enoyl-CoA hydratase [Rhodospirillaceae bacterium]
MSTRTESSPPVESILLRADSDGIARLTLNRPEQYNSLSEDMLGSLQGQLDAIAEDKSVRVVVLAAAGKAFCAGHDLKEMRARPERDYYEFLFKKCSRMMLSMVRLPQPVIARVHGIATAAGCQLVANADLAVAASDARFGTSGINVGLFCMTPGVAVARDVQRKKAFEMLFTGDLLSAEEARKAGLVNRVAPPDELDDALEGLCRSILGKSRAAVEAGKRVFYEQLEMDLESAYMRASEEMARNMMFHDAGEGIDAFIGKRKPVWTHE